MKITELFPKMAGVSAFSTHAGFNICTYAGASAADAEPDFRRLEALTGLDRSRIYLPVQTHSARIAVAGADDLRGCDGVVARGRGIAVGIHTADCLPLLLVDTRAEVIAAVHCGWRGTVAGIAINAVNAMTALGADPARIIATIGPHICPDCFEVGEEVAAQFPADAVIRRPDWPKPHVDLARAVELQLHRCGITTITNPRLCSKHTPTYYSVRRQSPSLPHRTLTLLHLTGSDGVPPSALRDKTSRPTKLPDGETPSLPNTPSLPSSSSPFYNRFEQQDYTFTGQLPHLNQNLKLQFITFRLHDSLPQSKINELQQLKEQFLGSHPLPLSAADRNEYAKLITPHVDQLLDNGHGECILRHPRLRQIVANSLHHLDGKLYRLIAYVIMPNHVHLLIEPHNNRLHSIIHSIKSFTAHQINKAANTNGPIWQKDYHDRIIRNPEHLNNTLDYIRTNPANLPPNSFTLYVNK
ncbi:MAG: hypothetical protein HDR45_03535 [Bacteroides sp.]|nr:hypothetical protein [Bacteroides sp.]